MIATSILSPVTFKNITGSYPNSWNTLHALRKQGGSLIIPYTQKFHTNHTLHIQFFSDSAAAIVLKSIHGTVEVETIAMASVNSYGTTNIRYYSNFTVILDSAYTDKEIYFTATQGTDVLTSEPILVTDLTLLIARGLMKYIKYTNLDRIESDLDDRFIDWEHLPSTGKYLDFYVEAQDLDTNDTDESEILEGSQTKVILSAVYYTGRMLKTGALPDYMCTRLGMASSLDVFTVNDIEYIKQGEVSQGRFGQSTLYQAEMKLTQKNAIGINVDILGDSQGGTEPPVAGSPMYVGSVTSAAPSETEVKTITSATAVKANQTKIYTITQERPCFAYPTSFGALSSILDTIGDEIITGFSVQTLNFTIGANTISYDVYTFKSLATVSNFTIIFKF